MKILPIVLQLMLVHGPGGQEIHVNIDDISSIRTVREQAYGHFAPDVRCLIFTQNGKFIAVTETCLRVRQILATINRK